MIGLDPATRTVLEAVPAKKGAGPAEIATAAGVGMDEALRRLGLLAAGGFIERAASGWRVRPGTGTAKDAIAYRVSRPSSG